MIRKKFNWELKAPMVLDAIKADNSIAEKEPTSKILFIPEFIPTPKILVWG